MKLPQMKVWALPIGLIYPAKNERGQTTSEYVAIASVAVGIAITVVSLTLVSSLSSAVEGIGQAILDFQP